MVERKYKVSIKDFQNRYRISINDLQNKYKYKIFCYDASSKTISDFDKNAREKTQDFNSNASSKLNEYNTNATEKLTAYNENAQNKTDEFNENAETIQKDVTKLKHRVSDLESNQLMSTVTGTEIHVEDAHETEVVEDKMSKLSSQETTTGKNIFHIENVTSVGIYLTYEKVNENKIILTLINPTTYRSVWFPLAVEKNTTYYFKAKTTSSNSSMQTLWLSVNTSDNSKNIINRSYTSETEISFNSGDNELIYVYLYASGAVGGQNVATWENIQLTKTSGDSFEPYTGGSPAPSPDFPMEIKTVKGYRNEFDEEFRQGSENTSINTQNIFSKNDLVLKAGTYTFSTNLPMASFKYAIGTSSTPFPASATYIGGFHTTSSFTFTLTEELHVGILINANNEDITPNDVMNYHFQLTEGTEEKPYVPYGNNYVYKKIVGKNLFDKDNANVLNGYIPSTGIITAEANNRIIYLPVKNNTDYTIKFTQIVKSGTTETDDCQIGLYQNVPSANQVGKRVYYSSRSIATENTEFKTTINTENYNYIAIKIANIQKTDFNASIETVMLTEGTQATSYEPYQENIITIPLNGNEIAGTDSAHKDILLVDSDGHCYLQKNTRGLELAIDAMDNLNDYPGWKNVPYIVNDLNANGYIENYTTFKSNITNKNNRIAVVRANNIIYLDKTYFGLNQTQWIEQYPDLVFKLLYALQTPQLIDLNYDVDIRLFNGVNNISNSDDMDMEIKYVQDISTIISNINNAILEIGGN